MTESSYAKSITLPHEDVFRNLKTARRFAVDIGGSLAKLAYTSTVQRKTSLVTDEDQEAGSIYQVWDQDEHIARLHFVKFETKFIETCLGFIKEHIKDTSSSIKEVGIKVTGGGAYKYKDLISSKLGVQVDKEDEMQCLIKGCNFLLKNIPDEAFVYQRHGAPEYKFQGVDHNIFPYLLVNIGSGVSLIKVESEDKFERIGGTATGGGTFWGLGSLLTKAKTFDELLSLAEKGDHRNVDMLVKDIYGGTYSLIGLPGEVIASSFGKAARSPKPTADESSFKDEDIAKSLLLSISNDIGQIAYLHAKLHNLKKIYFGGFFIRGHPITMHTITYAINFWSKGEIQPLFLRHEGYLGAIGAFLKGAEEEDAEKYSWEENFAGSSGLSSPKSSVFPLNKVNSKFDMLELDRLEKVLLPCPLLLDPDSYLPDTEDLTQDQPARDYWLDCFVDSIDKQKEQATKSQSTLDSKDVLERAEQFKEKFLQRLEILKRNPCAFGSLNVRGLLDMRAHCQAEFDFTDPYSQQKQFENEYCLKYLGERLSHIDSITNQKDKLLELAKGLLAGNVFDWGAKEQKQFENEHCLKYLGERLSHIDSITNQKDKLLELAKGLLAGNVFDWGAKEVATMMEDEGFSFDDAQNKLQSRPWLMDDCDAWLERRTNGHQYKCVVIFCDNSGADIILGIFPFARDLLLSGSKVIICANSRPVLNDVTHQELTILVRRVSQICPVISSAADENRLIVMASGQGSPCLDLRLIDRDLVHIMEREEADLIVIEGMGRAIHTNFEAKFRCDSLKVAVLKNRWLAKRLGGDMFSVVFKFETSNLSTTPIMAEKG